MKQLYVTIFLTLSVLLFSLTALSGPGRTTYQARIIKPDGSPLESSNVNFKFTILDPAGTCTLYSETFSSINMSSTGGLVYFSLGSGVKTYPVSATTFEQVFSNITSSLSCDAGGPANYSPAANDIRKIVMQFHDGSGWQTLPAMSINAVPYAMYANEAQKLNGLTSSDFVQVSTVPTCTVSEALRYTGAGFSCVAVGSGSGGSVTSGSVITALGYTPADGASVTTLTSSLTTANSNISSVSSAVFSVSSTVTSLQNSVAASFAAIAGSQWVTSGTSIYYSAGNVGVGTATPTARLHLAAGSATQAAFKLTSGTLLASPASGAVEYDGTNLYFTDEANTRRTLATITNSTGDFKADGSVSMTGQFKAISGNLAAPGIIFANDPDTGFATTAPNTMFFVTGGLGTWLVTSTSLGTNAAGPTLRTANTQASPSIGWTFDGDTGFFNPSANTIAITTSGTEKMRIDSTGNVGIGTTSPLYLLDLNSTTSSSLLRLNSSSTGGSRLLLNNTSAGGSLWQIFSSGSGNTSGAGKLVFFNGTPNEVMTLDTAGNVGVGTTTPVTRLDVSGGVRISMESATCAASYAGTLRYNSGNVEYCNGTTWSAFGTSGAGLQSLNGSISGTQIFATGTGGTAPNFVTTNGTHTFHIPYASAGAVTAGLISNADYLNFSNKMNTTSAAVITALGYTPANSATIASSQWNTSGTTINYMNGNVGVGTTTPRAHLDVSGSVTIGDLAANNAALTIYTQDSGSVSHGIVLIDRAAGYGSWQNPSGLDGIDADSSGTVTGWGGLYLNYYSSGNIDFNYGGGYSKFQGRVAIGMGSAPTARLHIAGGTSSSAALKFTSGTLLTAPEAGAVEYDGFNFYITDGTNTRRTIATSSSSGTIDNATNINSTSNITLTPAGSVIVSSTTASADANTGALVVKGGLGVAGAINAGGSLNVSGSAVIDGSLKLSSMTSGSVLFAGSNGTISQDNASFYWDGANKRLGLGTTSPSFKLEVSGTTTSDRKIGIAGTQVLYLPDQASSGFTGSLFVGDGGSTLSHAAGTEGYQNTGVGIGALYSNTTGYYNTATGYQALQANADGTHNTANGKAALFSNISGSENTATGYETLYFNTYGSENTATGNLALQYNTTGSQNAAYGNYALRSNDTGTENTATGHSALYSNTDGYQNTANGSGALYYNTSGSNNTANGADALRYNTTGYDNTATGHSTLQNNTTGDYNTANGSYALRSNTEGGYNTANGFQALFWNTTGFDNTANGESALYSNTTGNGNAAYGNNALYSNKTGNYNIAVGNYALYSNTTGSSNTANGYFALHGNKTKSESTAIGYYSMRYADSVSAAVTSSYNTAVGAYSLQGSITASINTGVRNTALGHSSLKNMTSGSSNTAIGYNAGSAITTGNNNVILGSDDGSSIATSSNYVLIADGAGNRRMTINGSGNVGMGMTSPVTALQVSGTIAANDNIAVGPTGAIVYDATPADLSGSVYSGAKIGNRFLVGTCSNATCSSTTPFFQVNPSAQTVGIGTTIPASKLGIDGNLAVGSAFVSSAAPTNGAIIQGNVGIGTSAPTVALDVSGTMKISGGSPGAGKVLTSDASGNASWQTPSGGGTGFSNTVYLTTGTSWTVPAGVTRARVTVQAGGGGGSGSSGSTLPGNGGGGGGFVFKTYTSLTPGTSASIAVGGGGSAGSVAGNGGTGGTTSFTYSGVTISATGGTGGVYSVAPGSGGTGSGGDLNSRGGSGFQYNVSTGGAGGAGYFQGAGGPSVTNGQAGLNGGGGAGGGDDGSSRTGGAGGAGVIVIEY